jgi:hypothetical protein
MVTEPYAYQHIFTTRTDGRDQRDLCKLADIKWYHRTDKKYISFCPTETVQSSTEVKCLRFVQTA